MRLSSFTWRVLDARAKQARRHPEVLGFLLAVTLLVGLLYVAFAVLG
jgi:hypothetical protein